MFCDLYAVGTPGSSVKTAETIETLFGDEEMMY